MGRRFGMAAALAMACIIVTMCSSPGFGAGPLAPSDDYILGYASALLRKAVTLDDASVSVRKGDVTVVCRFVDEAEAGSLTRALSDIPGVRSVRILTPGDLPPEGVGRGATLTPVEPHPFVFLPEHTLFRPLLADQRWPHFAVSYRYYQGREEQSRLIGANIGASLPLLRYSPPGGHHYEFGLQGSVFSIFDPDEYHTALVNSDFIVSLPVSWRYRQASAMLRFSHESTHLGDEYIAVHGTNGMMRISYEFVDLLASYDVYRNTRTYIGLTYRIPGEPERYDPLALRVGFEARSSSAYLHGAVRPLLAFDILNQQENNWNTDLTARAGFEFQGAESSTYRLQLLLEYYDGHVQDGQFFGERARYTGFAMRFDFQ